jgi:dienelactone hydrolase
MRAILSVAGFAIASVLFGTVSAERAPNVQTKEVKYTAGKTNLTGLIAWYANAPGKRPGVLVVHEWWGHDEHARNQAKRLAESGYVALALDMYGDGKHADHPEDAQKFAAEATKDPAVVTARFNAARDVLVADSHVDKDKIAAIGYCFGGGIVLNMARAGQDLDAVVTFHGSLDPALTAKPGGIKARILVLAGGADPFVPPATVEKFRAEMKAAGANFRIVTYPGVKHSFTNPRAESHGMPELGYNKDADTKSWQEMLALFKQVFQ